MAPTVAAVKPYYFASLGWGILCAIVGAASGHQHAGLIVSCLGGTLSGLMALRRGR